jgi:hypothetical protein
VKDLSGAAPDPRKYAAAAAASSDTWSAVTDAKAAIGSNPGGGVRASFWRPK